MPTPATRDLVLYRGDDYAHELTFTNDAEPPVVLDLSPYTFKAQIRDRPENGTVILATFSIDNTRASSGVLVLHLGAGATRIPSGFWDLEAHFGLVIKTWLKGSVTVSGDVTQGVTP